MIRKVFVFAVFLLAVMAPAAGSAHHGKVVLGAFSGWSFGSGPNFTWMEKEWGRQKHTLTLNAGGYVRYDLSRLFALQLELCRQFGTMRWIWPEEPEEAQRKGFYFTSFQLNGVVTCAISRGMKGFLLGGGCLFSGSWADFTGPYFGILAGGGIAIALRPGSPSSIMLRGTFHHLMDHERMGPWNSNPVRPTHADFFQVSAGFEFRLRDSGARPGER